MISEGCAHCYAEERDRRWHQGQHWGKGAPRKKSVSAVNDCRRFSKNAEDGCFIRCGGCGIRRWRSDTCCGFEGPSDLVRPTQFVMSLGDFADAEVSDEWRAEALTEILAADGMDFMILTKRPEALPELWMKASLKMTPAKRERVMNWLDGDVPAHIAIGATIESRKTAEGRMNALAHFPAARRFISAEPLLSGGWADRLALYGTDTFHLLIAGGESGNQARPMHPGWAEELERACDANFIPYHFKQWGEWVPADVVRPDWTKPVTGNFVVMGPDGKPRAYDPKKPPEAPDVLLWRAGKKASGWAVDPTGRTRTERLAFPTQPWKERWWKADVNAPQFGTYRRLFPGLVPAQEWAAADPCRLPLVKPLDGCPRF